MAMSQQPSPVFEKFENDQITDDMLKEAAELFSANYGVWGPLAEGKMGNFAKQGRRVRMSPKILREQCLPTTNARNTYVRVKVQDELIGNAFATRWIYEGRSICWVTQLCISSRFRRQGLATKLLRSIREGEQDRCFGILSSHPAALFATLRAFGRGHEEINHSMTRDHARETMASSPVNYVRTARLYGSLFDKDVCDGSVSCADTQFWVDHAEPLAALEIVRAKGITWPFGELLHGHEFLLMVEAESE